VGDLDPILLIVEWSGDWIRGSRQRHWPRRTCPRKTGSKGLLGLMCRLDRVPAVYRDLRNDGLRYARDLMIWAMRRASAFSRAMSQWFRITLNSSCLSWPPSRLAANFASDRRSCIAA